jgi:hypothetical protein
MIRGRKGQKPGRLCGRRAQHPFGEPRSLYCWPHYKQLVARDTKQKPNSTSDQKPPSQPVLSPESKVSTTVVEEKQLIELPLTEEPPSKKPRVDTEENSHQQNQIEKTHEQIQEQELTQSYDWLEEIMKGKLWDSLADSIEDTFMNKVIFL